MAGKGRMGGRPFWPVGLAWVCFVAISQRGGAHEWSDDLALGTGYDTDRLDWSIAGNLAGRGPNVLSELSWEKLRMAATRLDVEATMDHRLLLQGELGMDDVGSGQVRDSDYDQDNRTGEFSRSESESGGAMEDGNVAVGYRFHPAGMGFGRDVSIAPLLGYAADEQNLTLSHGVQVIPATGPLSGLHSVYHTRWLGPFAGVALDFGVGKRTRWRFEANYHYAYYQAEADWNLRTDLAHPVSFMHRAQGDGVVAAAEATQQLTRRWSLRVRFESQTWHTYPGVDTTYTLNRLGEADAESTRLNRVEWLSLGVELAAVCHF